MFTPDKPIECLNDDKLGRANFAKHLGNAIASYNGRDSFVIGLYGVWGSGKTSVVNMTINAIELSPSKPIIIRFNPWNYSDQNQLTYQFFKQLAYEIGIADTQKHYKKVINSLEAISKLVAPIAAVHASGIALKDIINSTKEVVKKISDTQKNNLELLKREINVALSKYDKKILIVIDDVDRLNKQEIRQIFQLIKSLADFKNTLYLLSLDKDIVAEALEDISSNGHGYLEKIIQASFELPPASQEEVANFLFQQLDEILQTNEKQWNNKHWGNIYHSGIKHYFKTIRDVVRYTNALSFSYELVRNEVNPVDFVAITALQVFDSQVYTAIQEYRSFFLEEKRAETKKQNEQILEDTCGKSTLKKEDIERLLIYLFPRANQRTNYSYEWLPKWRKELKICSPDLFDIFFRLSLTDEQLSQTEIDNALSVAENADDFSSVLKKIHEKGKITVLLDRLMDYHEEIKLENIENVFVALLGIGDMFLNKRLGMGWETNQLKISRLLFHLAKRLDADSYYNIVCKSIEYSSDGAYICLYTILRIIDAEEEAKQDPYVYRNYPLLDSVQKETLKELIDKKLGVMCESKQLAQNSELYSIFVRWLKISDELLVRRHADILLYSDDALLKFICSAVSVGHSQSINDLVAQETLEFNCKNMAKLIDIQATKVRVQNIIVANHNLTDRDKKILELFIQWDGVYK